MRVAETGRIGHHGDVGQQGDAGPEAHGVAGHCAHDGEVHVEHVPHDRLAIQADVGGIAGLSEPGEPGEVAAGGEGLFGASQQHGSGFTLLAQLLEQQRQLVVHLGVDLV